MLASLLEADHFVQLFRRFQRMLIWSGVREVVVFTLDRIWASGLLRLQSGTV
jgi:hypothetical protein